MNESEDRLLAALLRRVTIDHIRLSPSRRQAILGMLAARQGARPPWHLRWLPWGGGAALAGALGVTILLVMNPPVRPPETPAIPTVTQEPVSPAVADSPHDPISQKAAVPASPTKEARPIVLWPASAAHGPLHHLEQASAIESAHSFQDALWLSLRALGTPSVVLGLTWKSDPTQLIVAAVRPSSAAAEAKIQAGDIILSVENQPVTSPHAFQTKVQGYAAGVKLKLQLQRGEKVTSTLLVWPGGSLSKSPPPTNGIEKESP